MTKEEAIEILNNVAWLGTNEDRVKTEEAVAMAIQALEHAPTIEAEPVRHGEWIRHREQLVYVSECSVCGQKYFNPFVQSPGNYCSNCGSKNVGGELNETQYHC